MVKEDLGSRFWAYFLNFGVKVKNVRFGLGFIFKDRQSFQIGELQVGRLESGKCMFATLQRYIFVNNKKVLMRRLSMHSQFFKFLEIQMDLIE